MIRLKKRERIILKKENGGKYKKTNLLYVYFIYIDKDLVYIGSSKNPKNRISNHKCILLRGWQYMQDRITVEIYGPFEYRHALMIEADQIAINKKTNNLININSNETVQKSRQKAKEKRGQGSIEGCLPDKPGMVLYY